MPRPVLQAMVLADHVYRDAGTGKFIIAGTFGIIWHAEQKSVPHTASPGSEIESGHTFTGPITQAGSPYLYLALTEVRGNVPLRLRYVNLADSTVLMEAQLEVTSADPIGVAEFGFPLPLLPTNAPGHFSLDLLHEGEILGSWRVTIKQREEGNRETET